MNSKKALKNDIILIVTALIIILIPVIYLLVSRSSPTNKIAKIYVKNDVVETISLKSDQDEKITINGINGELVVHCYKGSIGVISSSCPHKDCINVGYISTTAKPIICAYNAVSIEIVGAKTNDIEVG